MASAAPGATADGAGGADGADAAMANATKASATPLATGTASSGAPLSAASLDASLAELATTLLPATRHAGDTLLERVMFALCYDSDASEALDQLDARLAELQKFLRDTGLSGIPLTTDTSHATDVPAETRSTFEMRARLSDATALVSSILRADE
ncbi:hypothetical protein MBRA1_002799 [Malassezia brasiliensis]|uniref:Uncharacterized protein n=1 Tax=Malassezia brasiliensis TaxID=1821822 RepID=A0AAF0DVC2_9BASI|nr:hypothetical protein MBRA1_002799 [Malassezia brasiliensis]